jgi:hypothetical protein
MLQIETTRLSVKVSWWFWFGHGTEFVVRVFPKSTWANDRICFFQCRSQLPNFPYRRFIFRRIRDALCYEPFAKGVLHDVLFDHVTLLADGGSIVAEGDDRWLQRREGKFLSATGILSDKMFCRQ